MELAAHWHRCQNLPQKRVNTLLLYRERDDPVKERLANWRTRSGTLGSVEERYTGTLHGRTSKILATWQIDSYPRQVEAWESGLELGGPREHRRIRYDDVFRVLTLPGSPRETALVYRNHGIQFHYLLYWNDVFASPGIIGTKVKLRFDPFDISHIYVYVHNHWVECITSSYYGQLHGHSEREMLNSHRANDATLSRFAPIDLTTLQVYEEFR